MAAYLAKRRFSGLTFQIRLGYLFLVVPLLFSSCAPTNSVIPDSRLKVAVSVSDEQMQRRKQEPSLIQETTKEPSFPQGFKSLIPLRAKGPSKYRVGDRGIRFSKTKMVSVAVDNMPLPEFIHYIFSDIFSVNYVLDSRIERRTEPVTLNLKNPLSEYQLFVLVKNVLGQKGLSIFVKDRVYYIWQQKGIEEVTLGIGASISDVPATTGKVEQIIPVRYVSAQDISNLLPRLLGVKVLPSLNENTLVVTGTRDQIIEVLRFLEVLDRPAMRGRYVGMVHLIYWSPGDMVKKLSEILIEEGIPVADRPGRKGVYMTTVERWGTIIFFAAERQWLERIKYWTRTLDVPSGKKRRYFLYVPQNSRASELGEVLAKILALSAHRAGATPKKKGEPRVALSKKSAKMVTKQKTGAKALSGLTEIGADVSMVVDEPRNALIVYTTPERYKEIYGLLEQLDVMPVQVLLEATVAEVTLTGSLQYGLEWFLKNTSGSQTSILKTLGGLGLGSGGLDYSLVTDTQKFQLLINALAKKDMVKILSSPRVTVRDGKSASIVVGTEVPVITSEATTPEVQSSGTSGIIRSVQYRSTGVSLQVTPTVQAKGVVTLQITQEVSEAQANAISGIDSPIILNRHLTTEVVAADGQTVLLGGLIKENKSNTVTKVPILGDIPILGYLFKTTSKGSTRTELVVMITPRIIRNTQQIDEIRDAIFKGFEHLSIERIGRRQ